MIRRPPRSTPLYSSAASDVYKRQVGLPPDEWDRPSQHRARHVGDTADRRVRGVGQHAAAAYRSEAAPAGVKARAWLVEFPHDRRKVIQPTRSPRRGRLGQAEAATNPVNSTEAAP